MHLQEQVTILSLFTYFPSPRGTASSLDLCRLPLRPPNGQLHLLHHGRWLSEEASGDLGMSLVVRVAISEPKPQVDGDRKLEESVRDLTLRYYASRASAVEAGMLLNRYPQPSTKHVVK
jgi:hypothetical protein